MKWLRAHLRARRINKLAQSRLRKKYMRGLEVTDDNEQQADLCAQFAMITRRIKVEDVKLVREARKLGLDWQSLSKQLDSTRLQRILGL